MCGAWGEALEDVQPVGNRVSSHTKGRWPRGISLEVVPQASAVSVED